MWRLNRLEEYLNRLRAAGKSTNIRWKLQKQLPGRRQAGQRWVDHFTSAVVDKLGFTRCVSAPQFFWNPERQVGMEVHMDDVHGFGPDPQVQKFKEDLAAHIWFRDGGVHHDGAEYDHLKRFRKKLNGIESNPKYLDAVLELLWLEGAKDVPTPSVPGHKEKLMTGELLNSSETTVYRQCVGGLLYYTQDRADAQYEVSILGSMLGKPNQGSMTALKRVTRYLKGTRDFVNKLELDNEIDKRVLKLDGYSDSDWAGSTDRKSQSSGVLFVDGALLYSFSRRQSVIATSSGTAEFYAGCATAEEMLLARDVLMFFGYRVEASLHMDSAAARGICRREGVGKVKSLLVHTLWLQQVIKAKTLTLKTVMSHDNCADLGTKTLTAATLTQLRSMNSLVDKKAMDDGCRAIRGTMTSAEDSDRHKILVLNVLEQALDDIARDGHKTSGGEKLLRALGRNLGRNLERNLEQTLESKQLCAMCTNSLLDWSKRK